MFLKKLYQHNKFWFGIVVLFLTAQLFLNYKNGLEASPFYHYSMYSILFKPLPKYEVVEVKLNGKILQAKDFTPNEWDNIVIPVLEYQHQQNWNSNMYQSTIKRLLPFVDSSAYINHFSKKEFDSWYANRVRRLLHQPASATVQYKFVTYQQTENQLLRGNE